MIHSKRTQRHSYNERCSFLDEKLEQSKTQTLIWRQLLNICSKGRPRPPGHTLLGFNTIHRPTAQKTTAQHPDRFWTFTCFDNSRWLRWNFDVGLVPLEALLNSFSIYMKNVQNGLHMWLGHLFGACCSWTLRWTRTWVVLGLHLGDSN
jgi:hypothetical protein